MRQVAQKRVFWAIPRRFAKRAPAREHAAAPESVQWRLLGLLNIYRLFLAAAALIVTATPVIAEALRLQMPLVASFVAAVYFAFALAVVAALAFKWPALRVQALLAPFADIVATAIIVQVIGANLGIFAVLLTPPVAVASAIAPRLRNALFFAALATIILLGTTPAVQLSKGLPISYYTEAGFFGIAIFMIAALAYRFARELLESQALAASRGAEIAQLNEINRRIIAELPTGIVVVDAQGVPLRTNPAARRLLGDAGLQEIARLAKAQPARRMLGLELKRGTTVMATTLPLGEAAGDVSLVFVEGAEVALQQAQELKLAALGRLSAAVAHQVRNPLGAIAHAAQLLEEGRTLAPRELRLARIIRRQSARLDGLVNDILGLSRPGQGMPRPLRLRSWLHDYLAAYRDRQPERATRLDVTLPDGGLMARCDPGHLGHILGNLIDNAFQHGDPEGRVELEIHAGEGLVAFDVLDRGPGLPADLDGIFEPFATTHASGTGLGLYIARELASANGGRLSAAPRERGGARFHLELAREAESAD